MLGKWFQRGILVGGALLTAAVIGPGCAEPESSLFIRHVTFLQPPDCVARAEPDGLFLGTGLLDVGLRDEYRATLLVGNQLVARGDNDTVRTESSRMALRSATVRVEDVSGNVLSDYEVPVTGFVDQSAGTEPGYGLAMLPLIDSGAINKIRGSIAKGASKRLVTFVKVTGHTLGGSDVTSGEFQFVVQACNGCLVQFPAEADDPDIDGIDCLKASDSSTATNANTPCQIGQDTVIDCRLCRSQEVCQRP